MSLGLKLSALFEGYTGIYLTFTTCSSRKQPAILPSDDIGAYVHIREQPAKSCKITIIGVIFAALEVRVYTLIC